MKIVKIKKIDYKFALILGLIEAVALFLIALFNIDMSIKGDLITKFLLGFATGFLTLFILIPIINLFIKKFKISKFNVLIPSIFNGLFIAILFTIESALSFVKGFGVILGNAIASLTTPLSLIIILLIYNVIKKDSLKISFFTKSNNLIKKFNILPIVLFALVYEILFLPSFAFLTQNVQNKLLFYPIMAFLTGTISCLVVILFYNKIIPKNKKWIIKV